METRESNGSTVATCAPPPRACRHCYLCRMFRWSCDTCCTESPLADLAGRGHRLVRPKTGNPPIVEVTDRCQVGTLCHVRRPIQSFVHSEISCLLSLSPRHSTSRSSSLCSTLYRRTYATSKGYELTRGERGGLLCNKSELPQASFEGTGPSRVRRYSGSPESTTPGPSARNFDDSITRGDRGGSSGGGETRRCVFGVGLL